jgi:hypothetical protein
MGKQFGKLEVQIMTFIALQKHINLPKPIALTCSAILALPGNALCAIAPETKPGNSGRKFGDACREQADCNNLAKYDFYELAIMTFMNSINELYELTFTASLIMLTVLFISLFSDSASSAPSAV